MSTARVTSNGRITIPKMVRESLGIAIGARIEFVEVGKGVYHVLAATRDVRELKGIIAKPAKPVSVEGMIRAVARAAAHR